MNINQALRKKNVLIQEIKKNQAKITKYNSYATEKCSFELIEVLADLDKANNELIALKHKIAKANAPVYDKIFRVSELKSMIKFWRNVPVIEGKIDQISYRSNVDVVGDYKAYFSASGIDALITKCEEKINKLQSELEEFNSNTQV